MGGRNCCYSNREEFDNLPLMDKTIIAKSIFKITSKEKIISFDFAESYKTKRYKLKHKKRILIVTEDNCVSLVSFYLGNLTFLLNSVRVNQKYEIINCVFLDKSKSSRFVLILKDKDKNLEILVIKIEKDKERPPVELNLGEKDDDNDKTKSTTVTTISDRNKQAVESIVNSDNSSDDCQDNYSSEEESEKFELWEKIKYDSDNYFDFIPLKTAKKKFENLVSLKYNFYKFDLKLVIKEKDDISQTIVYEDYIYVYCNNYSVLKCYKLKHILASFKIAFTCNLNFLDPYTNLIFPIDKDNIIVIDGSNFLCHNKGGEQNYKYSFQDLFSQGQSEIKNNSNSNLNLTKVTGVTSFTSQSKLREPSINKEDKSQITNFFICGLCQTNKSNEEFYEKTEDNSRNHYSTNLFTKDFNNSFQQFISCMSINADYQPHYTNLRVLEKYIPFISEISFGPYDNGPLITGHIDGRISLWNIFDLNLTKTINIFSDSSIKSIKREPLGLSICSDDYNIIGLNITDKKFEYFFNENQNNELEKVVRFITDDR